MSVYSVKLKLLGEMSQLPDSQRLFGALVYLLAEHNGEEEARRFLKAVQRKEIAFNLSGVLPDGYLPVPKSYLEHAVAENDKNERDIYKQLKEMDFVPAKKLPKLVKSFTSIVDSVSYISLVSDQQVHVNQLSDIVDSEEPDEGNEPFSVQRIVFMDQSGEPIQLRDFEFYLACEDDCVIKTLLESVSHHLFSLGKRASQGYNLFEFSKKPLTCSINQTSTNGVYLNLGMLLPDYGGIEFKDESSFLEIFTSQRRPYSIQGRGYFISFIAPGSMIVTSDPIKAGKCVESMFEKDKGAIVYGRSFLYPFGGEQNWAD